VVGLPARSGGFQKLKKLLSADNVLMHFNASLPIGIDGDASDVDIGTVLFHHYPDENERPISKVSKILTISQRNYSQIQKEALAIVFALKFYHKPLLALFGPNNPTPSLAANCLALWVLLPSQFGYVVEYHNTSGAY